MANTSPLIILKIGGSVITDRRRERPTLLRSRLKSISAEIAAALHTGDFQLLIIHGAGSFGHPIVHRTGIHKGISSPSQRTAMAETQRLQTWLNATVVHHFLMEGLPAFPVQPSASAVMEAGHLVSMDTRVLQGLLDLKLIPVLYGVPAFDLQQGCSILSGDQLASYLYACLHAQQVLHGTNVKGVYTADPFQDPAARLVEVIDLRSTHELPPGVGGSSVTDVTGGLRKKLEELIAVRAGGQIFDATVAGNVKRALCGETVGTRILCPGEKSSIAP